MASCQTKTYFITNYLKRECGHYARIINEVDDYKKHILKKGKGGNECEGVNPRRTQSSSDTSNKHAASEKSRNQISNNKKHAGCFH